ncbi:type 3 dihydrofolate reductase [Flavobacterium sp. W21_SRS_FM6]|uniref:type 3 dihydrofolate reductase n=1 Tax=Flavobacterium sp. W21_SRS_FM6 TaxID=3240268 RepID=UPI003F8FF493
MIISMIVAMAKERVIGANNKMPWHLPADLKHFKAITLGKPVIMGRLTYDSIGKALPGRLNIVITRDENLRLHDATTVTSTKAALTAANGAKEVMIIGGGSIYNTFLPLCSRLYLTEIDLAVEGDTFFPDYLTSASWQKASDEVLPADEKNPHDCRFITLDKLA